MKFSERLRKLLWPEPGTAQADGGVGPALGGRHTPRVWKCIELKSPVPVSARQERIRGWEQRRVRGATLLAVGGGGIGGEFCEGAAQKGYGVIHICDGDIVTPSNLNRQKFDHRSLYRNKAHELARVLRARGFLGSMLVSHPCWFQELDAGAIKPDVVFCGVDNQLPATRYEVSRFCHDRRIPCVITGVTPDADGGYVFDQEPGESCWGCALKPDLAAPRGEGGSPTPSEDRCPEGPASIDILKALVGVALYAVDSLVMGRPRDWNFWTVSLSRAGFGGSSFIEPRPGCPLCGSGRAGPANGGTP